MHESDQTTTPVVAYVLSVHSCMFALPSSVEFGFLLTNFTNFNYSRSVIIHVTQTVNMNKVDFGGLSTNCSHESRHLYTVLMEIRDPYLLSGQATCRWRHQQVACQATTADNKSIFVHRLLQLSRFKHSEIKILQQP